MADKKDELYINTIRKILTLIYHICETNNISYELEKQWIEFYSDTEPGSFSNNNYQLKMTVPVASLKMNFKNNELPLLFEDLYELYSFINNYSSLCRDKEQGKKKRFRNKLETLEIIYNRYVNES